MTLSSMSSPDKKPTVLCSMKELLSLYPGARRTLFQRHHLGGCNSCAFDLEETLQELCARSGALDAETVLKEIEQSHLEDEKLLIDPLALRDLLYDTSNNTLRLLDLRTREEFDAVHIPTTVLLTEQLMQEAMATWPKEELLILIDHQGERGIDAAAYFVGHGFSAVNALRGGIDAYSEQADSSLPRYTIEKEEADS